MEAACRIAGCKSPVPAELAAETVCVSHFTLSIEQMCAELRRETVRGATDPSRTEEIIAYIAASAQKLSRVATNSPRLPDDMKARILNTFLTLMNLRENLDRAMQRAANR